MSTHVDFNEIANKLRDLGWLVQMSKDQPTLPKACTDRYPWLPVEVVNFLINFIQIVAPSQKAWLITYSELSGETDSAFSWNQWEQDSLAAASDDAEWQNSIRSFWDKHFPILISVNSGYEYMAICKDSTVVFGEEPEFEETSKVSDDFPSFLQILLDPPPHIQRLI